MTLQYLKDEFNNTTAVVVPITDWETLIAQNNKIDELSQSQMNFIDGRLALYKNNPENVMSIEQFFEEMNLDEV